MIDVMVDILIDLQFADAKWIARLLERAMTLVEERSWSTSEEKKAVCTVWGNRDQRALALCPGCQWAKDGDYWCSVCATQKKSANGSQAK